jgi:tRNA nucleotidyltransferase (CCA-adding enzyme)
MDELGALAALEPGWRFTGPAPEYGRMEDALAWASSEPAVAAHLLDPAQQRLLLVFTCLTTLQAQALSQRLRLRQKVAALARRAPEIPALLPALSRPSLRVSELDDLLRPLPLPLCLVILALAEDSIVWERVTAYLAQCRPLSPLVTGEDLRRLGVPRGPALGRIMRLLRAARLDGLISTREEALDLAERLAAEER